MRTIRCRLSCNCFPILWNEIKRARRELPLLFEVMVVLAVLCVILLSDVLWLNHIRHQEIQAIEELRIEDLNRFRKQYDAQMHAIQSRQKQLGNDHELAHAAEVDEMKSNHQNELEGKISAIQQQLNGLLGLSKSYWEKHAEKHHNNFDIIKHLEDKIQEEK